MTEHFRNALIRDLVKELKADYWKLYQLDNLTILKMYEILIPKDKQNCSLAGLSTAGKRKANTRNEL